MIGDSLEENGLTKLVSAAGSFLLHTFASMIVSPFVVMAVYLILENIPWHLKSLAEIGRAADPLFWGPGLILGFLLNYVTRHRAACWVWLSGLAWLAVGILDSVRHYDRRFYQECTAFANVVNAFFVLDSHRCGGGESTLEWLFFTMPALNSVAYAVGAWVAIKYAGNFFRGDTNQKTILGLRLTNWPRSQQK